MIISENFPYKHSFFAIFEQLTRIPHGSGNTAEIAKFCYDFAKNNGCDAVIDKVGNVIIKKTAGKGYEDSDPIIIQGHLDMVCEKTPESTHDFTKDPLKLKFDGKYILAEDTTLGGDDGIAVAFALALVQDKELQLPPLEILLTMDEETGLFGAAGLDGSMLSGKNLINLDSEEEGILLCGCAGGLTATVNEKFETVNVNGTKCRITLNGLKGGHSGCEIHRRRLNAALCLAKLIMNCGVEYNLVSYKSGTKFNAIPCVCVAEVVVADDEDFIERLNTLFDQVVELAKGTDDEPKLELTCEEGTFECLSYEDGNRVISYLNTVPDGVIKEGDTGVITSLNTGVSDLEDGQFHSEALIRSMVNDDLDVIAKQVIKAANKSKFNSDFSDRYSAWEYNEVSPLRDKMVKVYENKFGVKPTVNTIHAGLECGVISDKIPGMDAVSLGPDILDVHTVNERLDVESAIRCFEYLVEILKNI
ncbi:MAG: beta-Ala-His dipeptidase [Clostridia bacterium]|nr:beta-Ala-His dipeptidase [Clostridia bacterium]